MVEAAGVERDLAGFHKSLMVAGFWAKSREVSRLSTAADSTRIPSIHPISSVFLER